jgi:hypothetical protein
MSARADARFVPCAMDGLQDRPTLMNPNAWHKPLESWV